jgi:four helix bundle protein
VTKAFPSEEQFGLAFQLRKAAVSVPSNIAEAAAQSSKREFLHFLSSRAVLSRKWKRK